MRLSFLAASMLLTMGCASQTPDADAASTGAAETSSALDCAQPGSFPEAAMKGLGGTYTRSGTTPPGGFAALTIGPLQDIAGWGGKSADYTRDFAAPCAFATCTDRNGTLTTLTDNPAIGAYISFADADGAKDVYFVTASLVDASGATSAVCLGNAVTGDRFLLTRTP